MGDPVKLIILDKVLRVVEEEQLIAKAEATGNYLMDELKQMERTYPGVLGATRGRGMFIAFDIFDGKREKVVNEMLQRGKQTV